MEINFNLERLAIESFYSEKAEQKFDEASKAFIETWEKLFSRLLSCEVDYFYYKTNRNLTLFTRSIKTNGVQITQFWICDGELIPLSDGQAKTAKEAEYNQYGIKDRVTIQFS